MRMMKDINKALKAAATGHKLFRVMFLGYVILLPEIASSQQIDIETFIKTPNKEISEKSTDNVSSISGEKLKESPASYEELKEAEQRVNEDIEQAKQAEETQEPKEGKYDGVQVVPDIMATYCQHSGEDFWNDPTLIDKCIDRYVVKINDNNAQSRNKSVEDYNYLKLRVLFDLLGSSISKAAAIADYEEMQNKMAESGSKSQTERDDGAATSSAINLNTKVVNGIRELYAANLFWQAIKGIEAVDASIIEQKADENNEDKTAENEEISEKGDDYKVKSTAKFSSESEDEEVDSGEEIEEDYETEELEIEGEYLGNGMCKVNDEKIPCSEGIYSTDNGCMFCYDGTCDPVSCEELVVKESAEENVKTEDLELKGEYLGNGKCRINGKEEPCGEGVYKYGKGCVSCFDGKCSPTACKEVIIERK